jgi:hypothetical protein
VKTSPLRSSPLTSTSLHVWCNDGRQCGARGWISLLRRVGAEEIRSQTRCDLWTRADPRLNTRTALLETRSAVQSRSAPPSPGAAVSVKLELLLNDSNSSRGPGAIPQRHGTANVTKEARQFALMRLEGLLREPDAGALRVLTKSSITRIPPPEARQPSRLLKRLYQQEGWP